MDWIGPIVGAIAGAVGTAALAICSVAYRNKAKWPIVRGTVSGWLKATVQFSVFGALGLLIAKFAPTRADDILQAWVVCAGIAMVLLAALALADWLREE